MPTNRKDDELLRPSEAAKALGVARNTVMQRVARKQYRSEVVGGVTFVHAAEVLAEVAAKSAAERSAA